VVLAILALLISILLPSLAGVRDAARRTACTARMSQTGTLLRIYTADNQDRFPRLQDASYGAVHPSWDPNVALEKTWVDVLSDRGYLESALNDCGLPPLLLCPSSAGYENDPSWAGHMPQFGVNVNLSPPRRLESNLGQRSFFSKPFDFTGNQAEKIMLAESKDVAGQRGWFSIGNFRWIGVRHDAGRSANVVYLDGHAASQRVSQSLELTDPAHPFTGINFWRTSER